MTGLNALSLYLSSWFAHWAVTVRGLVGATVGMGNISLLEGFGTVNSWDWTVSDVGVFGFKRNY